MTEELARDKHEVKEKIQITYYFTVLFTAVGIVLVFLILYQKLEEINLFIILLSTSAGGIPVGFIGVFIDYKVSESRFKNRSLEQLK